MPIERYREPIETGLRRLDIEPDDLRDCSGKVNAMMLTTAARAATDIEHAGVRKLTCRIPGCGPIMVKLWGDQHVGSPNVTHREIIDTVRWIQRNPDVYVLLAGDTVDGTNKGFFESLGTVTTGEDQVIWALDNIIEPLHRSRRLIAMLVGHFGHDGWAFKQANIRLWALALHYLPGLPQVQQGAEITLLRDDDAYRTIQATHAPPSKSKADPLLGVWDMSQRKSLPRRPGVFTSAHLHVASVGESMASMPRHQDNRITLVASGTNKGHSNPDALGIALALGESSNTGQNVVLFQSSRKPSENQPVGEVKDAYPSYARTQGLLVLAALRLYNQTESEGISTEITEEAKALEGGHPEISAGQFKKTVGRHPEERRSNGNVKNHPTGTLQYIHQQPLQGELAEVYDRITYDVKTRLPILVEAHAGVRAGSHTGGKTELVKHLAEVGNDPYVLHLLLRLLVVEDLAIDPNRFETIWEVGNFLKPYSDRILLILLARELRRAEWRKSVGQGPFAPGSYLSEQLDTPLIQHLSTLEMIVNNHKLPFVITDTTAGYGSRGRPATLGLRQIYNLVTQDRPAGIIGGHHPTAQWVTFEDPSNQYTHYPVLLEPGSYSPTGKQLGSIEVQPMPLPGQGIIIHPDGSTFATINSEETETLFNALTTYESARILRKLTELKKNIRRPRKHGVVNR